MKIFNFHPTFIYLNSNTIDNYENLKKLKPLNELTELDMIGYINHGIGAGNFFNSLTTFIKLKQKETYFIRDYCKLNIVET